MAYYQCFKTTARNVYCSSYQVRNHDEGNAWVKAALENLNIRGSDMLGKPFELDAVPENAITYPGDVPVAVEN